MGKEKKEGGGGGGGGLCSTLLSIMCILRKSERERAREDALVGGGGRECTRQMSSRPALFLFRRHSASAVAPKTHFFKNYYSVGTSHAVARRFSECVRRRKKATPTTFFFVANSLSLF